MNKKWLILPVVLLAVFGLLMLGCPSGGGGGDDGKEGEAFSYEFKGDGSEYTLWGDDKPVLEDGWLKIEKGSSTSCGFQISFDKIGYTYNASDTLIFTYSVEVETPEACLSVKNPTGWKDLVAGASWDVGGGKQHFLGSSLKDKKDVSVSSYDTPTVATWDAATKTGTFQVLLKHLGAASGVGFQHNTWAQNPADSSEVSKAAKYKVKFLKVENAVGEAYKCECDGDKTKCECGEDCDCDPCAGPTGSNEFTGPIDWDSFVATGEAGKISKLELFGPNGFEVVGGNYDWSYVQFQVNLDGKKLSQLCSKITFTVQTIAGDVTYKPLAILVSDTKFDGQITEFDNGSYNGTGGRVIWKETGNAVGAVGEYEKEAEIDKTAADTATNNATDKIWMIINLANSGTGEYIIYNIEFVE